MFEKIKGVAGKAKESMTSAAGLAIDFAAREDVRAAAKGLKETAINAGNEAVRFGKEAAQSDLAKDAGAGAAVGAVMAVPVPLVGPMIGATAGATLGIYKNLTRTSPSVIASAPPQKEQIDVATELLKLGELKQKGIISDDEFRSMKESAMSKRS